jgi:hypothetical protein
VITKFLKTQIRKVLPTVIKKGATKNALKETNEEVEETSTYIEYTPEELEFIIKVLGEQTFKVKEIEFIYTLIVKLQSDYLDKTKKK